MAVRSVRPGGHRELFRGRLDRGILTLLRGAWIQRLAARDDDVAAGPSQWDASVQLYRSLGQRVMVSSRDLDDWAAVGLYVVTREFPFPSKVGLERVAGLCPDGEVYVERAYKPRVSRAPIRAALAELEASGLFG